LNVLKPGKVLDSSQDVSATVITCSQESGNDILSYKLISFVPDTTHFQKNMRNNLFYSSHRSDFAGHHYSSIKMHSAVGSMMPLHTISLFRLHSHYHHTCREGDEGDTDEENDEDELPLLVP
jgi:hypothetical protein